MLTPPLKFYQIPGGQGPAPAAQGFPKKAESLKTGAVPWPNDPRLKFPPLLGSQGHALLISARQVKSAYHSIDLLDSGDLPGMLYGVNDSGVSAA